MDSDFWGFFLPTFRRGFESIVVVVGCRTITAIATNQGASHERLGFVTHDAAGGFGVWMADVKTSRNGPPTDGGRLTSEVQGAAFSGLVFLYRNALFMFVGELGKGAKPSQRIG